MELLHKILIWTILISLPVGLFGQATSEYENEEVNVINQFFYKLIEADRLSTFNKSDSSLIVYFNTKLDCNLDKDPLLNGDYKSNKLLKRLEANNLGERIVDSLKIEKFNKIKIVFEDKGEYSLHKYSSDKVIGTFNISRISFNKSMTVGYFYFSIYCGGECGWGDLIKIRKKKGNWEIVDYLFSWVS